MNIKTTLVIDNNHGVKLPTKYADSCIDITNLLINKPTELLIFPYYMQHIIMYVLPFTCVYTRLLLNIDRYYTLNCYVPNTDIKVHYTILHTHTHTSTIKSIYKKENLLYQLQENADSELIKTLLTEISTVLNFKFQEWFKLNKFINLSFKD